MDDWHVELLIIANSCTTEVYSEVSTQIVTSCSPARAGDVCRQELQFDMDSNQQAIEHEADSLYSNQTMRRRSRIVLSPQQSGYLLGSIDKHQLRPANERLYEHENEISTIERPRSRLFQLSQRAGLPPCERYSPSKHP